MELIYDYYLKIVSIENLLAAWEEFVANKNKRLDVRLFAQNLFSNILDLHNDLINYTYRHARYEKFSINDPKPRVIHKAIVRDRLLHRAIYRILMPIFDQTFVFDSYSCRKVKGTHRGFKRLVEQARTQSKNYSGSCWALKCDVKKFFYSVDHKILIKLLSERIADEKLMNLLSEIIESFASSPGRGMPLGNLTSQLFANIYLDPLDKFVKHKLKAKYYLRYADDFIFLADNREVLRDYLKLIDTFLADKLKLSLHQDKVIFRKLNWGLDFVGYVAHPKFNLPRKATVKRMFVRLNETKELKPDKLEASLRSYLGYLKHVDAKLLSGELRCRFSGSR